jgi:GNAT superfamily N-acetyltransferase
MNPATVSILPYESAHLEAVVDVALRAWDPVFPLLAQEIPDYVYNTFYPDGWEPRQRVDVTNLCKGDGATQLWVAVDATQVIGFIGLRIHLRDRMGEVYILAVDPTHQQAGVGRSLLNFAIDWFRNQKLALVMVETGADEGHAPARAAYESVGFHRYPIARYFRKL